MVVLISVLGKFYPDEGSIYTNPLAFVRPAGSQAYPVAIRPAVEKPA
jgi:hypothetical protein